ncbi:MAG: uncharacterized membrane protein (UPF0127 family) [Alphaproteobacteria bacterium]|jgi:uncharacterized membrane protein (UPF0127 family)
MLSRFSTSFLVAIALFCAMSLSACAKPKNLDTMTDEEVDAWLKSDASDDKIPLTVSTTNIRVEYANTPEKRQLGLMFRRELCEDCGMLFKFDSPRIGSIWMKNTFVALDLAYIDVQGEIVDIKQLQPRELIPVKSSSQVLYALEMNKGWFSKQDIRVGDKVALLP